MELLKDNLLHFAHSNKELDSQHIQDANYHVAIGTDIGHVNASNQARLSWKHHVTNHDGRKEARFTTDHGEARSYTHTHTHT